MNIPKGFESNSDALLDAIGGEILAGSGFENEISDSEFSSLEFSTEVRGGK
jgi:hypothetical protein